MNSISNAQKIIDKIQQILLSIPVKKTEKIIKEIINADNVFVFGVGRSGLVGQAFAMRLVHLGKTVHFVGMVTTPAISPNDVIIVISGSGKTNSVYNVVKTAKKQLAKIIAITSKSDSSIAKLSDIVVRIPLERGDRETNNYLTNQLTSKFDEIVPMGTLFELTAMIYFDSIIPVIMKQTGVSEEYMKAKHSNLE